jgi:hypothetical protein
MLNLNRFSILCLLAAVSSPLWTRADDPPPPTEAPAQDAATDEEWTRLFDGESLKNWQVTDFGGQGSALVRDGLLVLEEGQPLTGVTWEGEELPKVDYEIRLEAQRVQGTDFFLALTFPVEEGHCSLVLGGWGGGLTGISSIDGFDASENSTTSYQQFENGRWYKVRVRVTGDKLQAWLDEEPLIDLPTEKRKFTTRIEVDQNKPLGMCTFMTEGAYRNVELRRLPAPETPPAE